jgi:peptidoglycan-N-acetylglucosamine deacetylase
VLHTRQFIQREIESTDAVLRRVGVTDPIAFRPPYGRKLVLLPWYLWRHRRPTIMWDVDAREEARIPSRPDVVAVQILKDVKPGSIILLHPMGKERAGSRAAIGPIITGLKARGYRFVTVAELLARRP